MKLKNNFPAGEMSGAAAWTIRICALFALLLICVSYAAQSSISGRVSGGFQAPTSTDAQGRRSVLKGESMEQRGSNVVEIIQPRVVNYNADDTPDMLMNSPECLYDMKASIAQSASTLSVRTADERFSITGTGWRWEPSASLLLISNSVSATVRKPALNTNAVSALPNTNEPVKISSTRFQQDGDALSFIGTVRVLEGTNTLLCDRLNLATEKPGGVQKIDAIGSVKVSQGGTEVLSGKAHYDFKENIVHFSDHPKWIADRRQGSSDLLTLNRSNDTVYAEGKVYMKLPMTNVVAASTVAPDAIAPSTNAPSASESTNRYLEVFANKFTYEQATSNRLARAIYEQEVRVLHEDETITCARLVVNFGPDSRIQHIRAEENVVIENGDNKAFGDLAEYDLGAQSIVLTGKPHWTLGDRKGSSQRLIFLTQTRETLALENVEMILPGQSLGGMFTLGVAANSANTAEHPATAPQTNSPMIITSDSFSHGDNLSVFQGSVRAHDDRGSIDCALLTIVTGVSNKVERMVAERNVVVRQPTMAAFGERAEYNTSDELVRLTGHPELIMPDKTLRADAFIIDRRRNTFSVSPGKYRIELQATNDKGKAGTHAR
jgi:lipopolysaccharide export system protein LptA